LDHGQRPGSDADLYKLFVLEATEEATVRAYVAFRGLTDIVRHMALADFMSSNFRAFRFYCDQLQAYKDRCIEPDENTALGVAAIGYAGENGLKNKTEKQIRDIAIRALRMMILQEPDPNLQKDNVLAALLTSRCLRNADLATYVARHPHIPHIRGASGTCT
jgi:hypothetical protein